MPTHIALLRGINVGGKSSLPMKDLTALLAELGGKNIRTYIQSGNVVFDHGREDRGQLAREISAEIGNRRGFEPEVLVLSPEELDRAVAANPFPDAVAAPTTLHLGFLAAAPENPDLEGLEKLKSATERYQLLDRVFYLHAPDGIGRSKLAARAERLLGVPLTDRNWRTVAKIQELVNESR